MHANAPLTAEGRRRLIARVLEQGRPQAHVAAGSYLARATVRKWVTRLLAGGEQALADQSSRPHRSPTQTEAAVVARTEGLRRDRKLPPRLIVDEVPATERLPGLPKRAMRTGPHVEIRRRRRR